MPPRRLPLLRALERRTPPVDDPQAAIAEGRVRVNGAVMTNPGSMVDPGASIKVETGGPPRGVQKLGFALDHFGVEPAGRTCLDLGACTGGFTLALLERGARKVFAVEVGYGQLLGSLRQDERVVNLERTNLGALTPALIDDPVDLLVVDVTLIPLGDAIAQVTASLNLTAGTEVVGLVKPMVELRTNELPTSEEQLLATRDAAARGVEAAGWRVEGVVTSAMRGSHGAVEFFVHARR